MELEPVPNAWVQYRYKLRCPICGDFMREGRPSLLLRLLGYKSWQCWSDCPMGIIVGKCL